MFFSENTTLTQRDVGDRYRGLDQATRDFIDAAIRQRQLKIATIKFLRSQLALNLTQAKDLYEAREDFLDRPASPYGF